MMTVARWTIAGAVAMQLVAAAMPPAAFALPPTSRADFNGDGFDDLAVGVPGEDDDAGSVHLIYGSAAGLTSTGSQVWRQGSSGILGVADNGDQFGSALAAGDFDGNGYADLAVGVVGEGLGGLLNSDGGVSVIYGSANGLTGAGNQFWDQDSPDIRGVNEGGEGFGTALAAGDFNHDGFTDLAIGVPGESRLLLAALGFFGAYAGAVQVLYGSANGLTAAGNQFWNQGTGLIGTPEPYNLFGVALAAADFDHDGFVDLAVGVPGEGAGNSGAVNVIYGSAAGLASARNQFWSQDSSGIAGSANAGDKFGEALTAGDFNGDGFFDLAVGVTGEEINGHKEAGAVAVIFGRAGGLAATNNQLWHQDVVSSTGAAIADVAEDYDQFGNALAAGDFNGDGKDDLAIGVVLEDIGSVAAAGVVHVLFGGGTVLSATGNQLWHQDVPGIEGTVNEIDAFGYTLSTGDFNGDGRDDLAVGTVGEVEGGAVNVIYGTATGLSSANDQIWSQDSPGIADVNEHRDAFGFALAGGANGPGGPGVSGEWTEVAQVCKGEAAEIVCTLQGRLVVSNPGTFLAAESVVRFFVSDDDVLDAADQVVAESAVDSLLPEAVVEVDLRVKLAKGTSAAGRFVLAVMDADDQVVEINEDNNLVPSPLVRTVSKDTGKCRRTIVKAAAGFVQAKARALQKCEDGKVKGTLASCPTSQASAAIAKAAAKLRDGIARACCGKDGQCTGGGDDVALEDVGWDVASCPNFQSGTCTMSIASAADVAACIGCIGEAAVDQAIDSAYASLHASDPATDKALNKCQQAVGKSAASFLSARSKALQACRGSVAAGKAVGACPAADGRAEGAIAAAEASLADRICKSCGGGGDAAPADAHCDRATALGPNAIGFAPVCPAVRVPGGPDCGAIGAVDSLDALIACLDCVTAFDVDCADRAAVPGSVPYPPECNP